MSSPADVFQAAMSLDSQQRAALAHQLILSLEGTVEDEHVEQAWADEIRARRQAIQDGQPLRDWADALGEIRKSIEPEDGA